MTIVYSGGNILSNKSERFGTAMAASLVQQTILFHFDTKVQWNTASTASFLSNFILSL